MTAGARALAASVAYLATAALLSLFGPYARVSTLAGRLGLPEETPGISAARVSIFLGRIGEEGRTLYTAAVLLDYALPALMALAGALLAKWARGRIAADSVMASLVVRLTILAVAAEVIENALLLTAVARYPQRPLLGNLIGVMVSAKFALILLTVIAGAMLAAIALLRVRRSPAPM
jgi:hypothetical protein